MEMYPGSSVVNHGDGGYMNVSFAEFWQHLTVLID